MSAALGFEWGGYSSAPFDDATGTGILLSPAASSFVYVDIHGNRFDDESKNLAHDRRPLNVFWFDGGYFEHPADECDYAHLPAFIVFDETTRTAGPVCARHGTMGWATAYLEYAWSEDNQAEIDNGWILKADTLEELAGKMHAADYLGRDRQMDAGNMVATIAKYNEDVTTIGYDTVFNRGYDPEVAIFASDDPSKPLPLENGPFYAMQVYPCLLYTSGGTVFDEHARVLDFNGDPIPRLYAAGTIGQTGLIKTVGMGGALATGRMAARHAATL